MTNLFYRNTRLLMLALSLIAVAGLSSYAVMPRLEDPVLTARAAFVNTRFPGASPERVESLVTERIEEELREISEIKEVRSSSRAGHSFIMIELRDDVYEVGNIWSRIRSKIDDAETLLPQDAGKPDFELAKIRAYSTIVALAIESDEELSLDSEDKPSYAVLRRWTEQLEDELASVPGTEEIDYFGDMHEEIIVEFRAEDLAALGLTAADVARQLRASDAKTAAGALRDENGSYVMEIGGELDSLDRVARTPIQYGGDQLALLTDVATVRRGIIDPPITLAMINGQRGIALGVMARKDYRIDLWTDNMLAKLDDVEHQLPRGLELQRIFVQNRYVEGRLNTLLINLFAGAAAVVVVVLLLMGWRSAIIVGLSLPLAALMVLAGMNFMGMPMHQMSITGLIIALGLLIDNAIVIVDEVQDKLREGHSPGEAVSESVKHLAMPLAGSTLTTALAFGPLALMPGPAGEFVGSIAISVILAIFSSFLLAMTITPALSALAARFDRHDSQAWWVKGFSNAHLTAAYSWTLKNAFARPWIGVAAGVLLPLIGFVQARNLSEQFFPASDRDQFHIEMEMPAQSSVAATLAAAKQAEKELLAQPEVESVQWFIGEHGPPFYYNVIATKRNSPEFAHAMVQLKSAGNTSEVIRRMQKKLDHKLPQARTLVRQLEQGPPFAAPIEVRLYGPSLDVLQDLGDEMRNVLAATSNVTHTRDNLNESRPKIELAVDEEQTRLAGLDHAAIAGQLNASLEGATGGSVLEATEELPVRVRVAGDKRADIAAVTSLDLVRPLQLTSPGDTGMSPGPAQVTPLTSLAAVKLVPEESSIPHFNGRRMNEVQGFIDAGVLPAEVLAEFQQRLEASDFQLPPGYSMEYGGEAAKRDDAVGNLLSQVGVLLVLMIATLVMSFGSFRMMGQIAAVAFLSVGLGLGALWLWGFPFGFMAIIGTMGLIGVAINDSIVVLAALRADPQARVGERQAVLETVVRSSRHVVATTLTTIAGFMPLILGGGGFWPPLAVAIAGGVGGATILALYFTPSMYLLTMCPRVPAETAAEEMEQAAPLNSSAEEESSGQETEEPLLVS